MNENEKPADQLFAHLAQGWPSCPLVCRLLRASARLTLSIDPRQGPGGGLRIPRTDRQTDAGGRKRKCSNKDPATAPTKYTAQLQDDIALLNATVQCGISRNDGHFDEQSGTTTAGNSFSIRDCPGACG
jgi:hypothetical protein